MGNASRAWLVANAGVIARWDGTAWTLATNGTGVNLYGVWGTDVNNVWAVGDFGTILKGDYDPAIRTYTDSRMEMSCKLPARPT